jgi:hypothetical protein
MSSVPLVALSLGSCRGRSPAHMSLCSLVAPHAASSRLARQVGAAWEEKHLMRGLRISAQSEGMDIKGKGWMHTFFLSRTDESASEPEVHDHHTV